MVPKRQLLWIVALVAVVAALVGGGVGVAVAIAADGGMPMMGDGGMGTMLDGPGGMDGGQSGMSEGEFERMHELCHQMMEDHRFEGTS